MNPPQPCVILKVGAEGGSITLLGMHAADGWRFRLKSTDHSDTIFDESCEAADSSPNDSRTADSWLAALELLDSYPWHRLYPLEVHPDFREIVFDTVAERYGSKDADPWDQLSKWRVVCGMPGD